MQWYDFGQGPQHHPILQDPIHHPQSRTEKSQFFKLFHDLGLDTKQHHHVEEEQDLIQCVIKTNHVYANAHDGYIYCMAYANDLPNIEGEVIITGSGDGNIKV